MAQYPWGSIYPKSERRPKGKVVLKQNEFTWAELRMIVEDVNAFEDEQENEES